MESITRSSAPTCSSSWWPRYSPTCALSSSARFFLMNCTMLCGVFSIRPVAVGVGWFEVLSVSVASLRAHHHRGQRRASQRTCSHKAGDACKRLLVELLNASLQSDLPLLGSAKALRLRRPAASRPDETMQPQNGLTRTRAAGWCHTSDASLPITGELPRTSSPEIEARPMSTRSPLLELDTPPVSAAQPFSWPDQQPGLKTLRCIARRDEVHSPPAHRGSEHT